MDLLIQGDRVAFAIVCLCIAIGLMVSTEIILMLRNLKSIDFHLYKSWDDSYYVTSKYDEIVGLTKKVNNFKGLLSVIKHVGFKAAWHMLRLEDSENLIVIS